MLFNSFQFALFFAVVFLALLALPPRARPGFLLLSSLAFYGLWVPSSLLVLGTLLLVNYALLRRIGTSARSRSYLVLSIVVCLSTLAFYKYGAPTVTWLSREHRGLAPLAARLSWMAMPLGISFYTFEMISIAVDVHRGRLPLPRFSGYALVVTFFPHLIAGPILRGPELLPQLDTGGARTRERARRGLWLFLAGLVKKVFLSDYFLQPFVTEAFAISHYASASMLLLGVYSFAFQIYCDFSGYTDMARGVACLLGFELPMNFEEPYLSRDPTEFWRRWHMTLSRWLRDYLYVPLGGNRKGPARTSVNLFLTMALGGLWHGAGAGFLLWGALHGLVLVIHRRFRGGAVAAESPLTLRDVPRILLTFHVVCLLWIPFRAPDLDTTFHYVKGLFTRSYLGPWPPLPCLVLLVCAAFHVGERFLRPRLPGIHARLGASPLGPILEGAAFGAIVAAAFFASGAGVTFIYFQF